MEYFLLAQEDHYRIGMVDIIILSEFQEKIPYSWNYDSSETCWFSVLWQRLTDFYRKSDSLLLYVFANARKINILRQWLSIILPKKSFEPNLRQMEKQADNCV